MECDGGGEEDLGDGEDGAEDGFDAVTEKNSQSISIISLCGLDEFFLIECWTFTLTTPLTRYLLYPAFELLIAPIRILHVFYFLLSVDIYPHRIASHHTTYICIMTNTNALSLRYHTYLILILQSTLNPRINHISCSLLIAILTYILLRLTYSTTISLSTRCFTYRWYSFARTRTLHAHCIVESYCCLFSEILFDCGALVWLTCPSWR